MVFRERPPYFRNWFGTGRFSIALGKKYPNSKIFGVDNSDPALKLSSTGAVLHGVSNVYFVKGDIFNLPFKDESFDAVFENGTIEHFENYEAAFQEMVRVTKKGGKIIINVCNYYCFPKTIYKFLMGKHFEYGFELNFKHAQVYKLYKKYGLKDIQISGYNPMHSIGRFHPILDKFVQRVLHKAIVAPLDKLTNNYVSKKFGFMICAKGVK